jgi:hypothetical protein
LRPTPPTAPAAPVTRIGLSCLCFVVMSLTLGYFKRRTGDARALERTAGGTPRAAPAPWFALHPASAQNSTAFF